jgi:DNA polymerase delta subunit 1
MVSGDPLPSHPEKGKDLPGNRVGPVPIIRLFGVTNKGQSVATFVHGFTPYFFCNTPPRFDPHRDVLAFQSALEQKLSQAAQPRDKKDLTKFVLAVVAEDGKQSLMGYHGDTTGTFLRVYVASPTLVPTARRLLESGFSFGSHPMLAYQTFESNVPFVLRYMIDNDIVGCNYLELKAGSYRNRTGSAKATSAQFEVDVVYDSVISHDTNDEWQRVAPFRVMSFDIECKGRKGAFPDPQHDPVIQIANVVTEQGSSRALTRNIMVLGTCTSIVGADVITFDDERELLAAWSRFVREADPDVLTGYNIENFDIKYLLERAAKLGVHDFPLLGRVKGVRSTMTKKTFQSAAFGKRENVETTIHGRLVLDMLEHMRRNFKLSSYSLNAVSARFLGQQKEDVHHSIISDLQEGTADDRRRLAVYCLKDALLPIKLMDKLMVMVNHVEMARVTGVPIDFILRRGQQIKVLSMLFRKCQGKGLLVPCVKREAGGAEEDGVAYEGATVIDPVKGYYPGPIATLDFASLYPSIMMAHNLCYSTLVDPTDVSRLPEGDYTRAPSGHTFVKGSTKRGVLPEILDELLMARKRAKKDMEAATDPMVKAVQNGRQLALKVSANSVYGFTGATVGQLPCLAISSTVTGYGRDMIHDTRAAVERMFTMENGYPADAMVVYGDTDSVMVNFGVPDVETAMKLGQTASEEVTKMFPPPVRLEFEKVYCPYLLMNKKRYAGLYWTRPDKWDKLDAKGIETVRRDNCALTRRVVDTVLRKILIERNVEGAIAYTKGVISDLLQNKLDISLLVITKALGKAANSADYKAKQAHVELAERMRKRDAGSAPVVGDRVPYVIIQAPKNTPNYEKSEDPMYVLEKSLTVDAKWYLDHQLFKPLTRIFDPIIQNTSSLFMGDHTRAIAKKTPTSVKGGIMAFATRTEKCMYKGCNVPLKDDTAVVCPTHAEHIGEVYQATLEACGSLEHEFGRLWTQCQRCQESLHQDVICTANDCPIFYMRRKVQMELEQQRKALERFGDAW